MYPTQIETGKFQKKKNNNTSDFNAYLALGLGTWYDWSTAIIAFDMFQLPATFYFFHHV